MPARATGGSDLLPPFCDAVLVLPSFFVLRLNEEQNIPNGQECQNFVFWTAVVEGVRRRPPRTQAGTSHDVEADIVLYNPGR